MKNTKGIKGKGRERKERKRKKRKEKKRYSLEVLGPSQYVP